MTSAIVNQAFIGLIIYVTIGTIFYITKHKSFNLHPTIPLVDALYFTMATLCTIGYGDVVPTTTFTKLFTCSFILLGFGFVDVLLHGLVAYVLDKQEAVLLTAVDEVESRRIATLQAYVMDMEKGRM